MSYSDNPEKCNRKGNLFVFGDEEENESIKFVRSKKGKIELRKNNQGAWQGGEMVAGAGTYYLGESIGLTAAGHHFMVEHADGSHKHLYAHRGFTESGTEDKVKIVKLDNRQIRAISHSDDSVTFTGPSFNYSLTSSSSIMLSAAYFRTGATAATKAVRISVYVGTDDTGELIWDYNYPAGLFPANTEIKLETKGLLEYEQGEDLYVAFISTEDFSLKTDSEGQPWRAADTWDASIDQMLSTSGYVDGGTYAVGKWIIDTDPVSSSRKIFVCNTSGAQTGTFASNIEKWDILGSTATGSNWVRNGTTLSPKNDGDDVLIENIGASLFTVKSTATGSTYAQIKIESNSNSMLTINGVDDARIQFNRGGQYWEAGMGWNTSFPDVALDYSIKRAANTFPDLGIDKDDGRVYTRGELTIGGGITDGATAATQSPGDNSTKLATTEYVESAVSLEDLWDRTGTVLSPKNAGDVADVNIVSPNATKKMSIDNSGFHIHDGTGDRIYVNFGGRLDLFSADRNSYLLIGDSSIGMLVDGTYRFGAWPAETFIKSEDGSKKLKITNTDLSYNDLTRDRIIADAIKSESVSPNGNAKVSVKNAGTEITGSLGIGIGTFSESENLYVYKDFVGTTVLKVENPNTGDASANIQVKADGCGVNLRAFGTGTSAPDEVWLDAYNNSGPLTIKSGAGIKFRTNINTVSAIMDAAGISTDLSLYQPAFADESTLIVDLSFEFYGTDETQYSRTSKDQVFTATGGVTIAATGGPLDGPNAHFDGTNDSLQCSNINGLDFSTTEKLTVECEAKADEVTAARSIWTFHGTHGSYWEVFTLDIMDANSVGLYFGDGLDGQAEGFVVPVDDVTAYHQYDATLDRVTNVMQLYVDSVLAGSMTITGENLDWTTPISLGLGGHVAKTTQCHCQVAKFKTYSKILSSDEIRTHYLRHGGNSIIKTDVFRIFGTDNTKHFEVDVDSLQYLDSSGSRVLVDMSKVQFNTGDSAMNLTDTDAILYFAAQERLKINATSVVTTSPNGTKTLSTTDSSLIYQDGARNRVYVGADFTQLQSESGASILTLDGETSALSDGVSNRVYVNATVSGLISPNGVGKVETSNTALILQNPDIYINDNVRTRISINNADTIIRSVDGNAYLQLQNTFFKYYDGTYNRLNITGSLTEIVSESGASKISVSGTGGFFNDGTRNRIVVNDSETYIFAPAGVFHLDVNDVGLYFKDAWGGRLSMTAGSLNYYDGSAGHYDRLIIDNNDTKLYDNGGSGSGSLIMSDGSFWINDGTSPRISVGKATGTKLYCDKVSNPCSIHLNDWNMTFHDGTNNRVVIDSSKTYLYNPGGAASLEMSSDGDMFYDDGTNVRLNISNVNGTSITCEADSTPCYIQLKTNEAFFHDGTQARLDILTNPNYIKMYSLPISDPVVADVLWNNGGSVMVSAG